MRGQNMDEVRTMQERGSIKACHHCHHTRHRRHLKHLLHQYHSYGSSWLHCGGCFAFERQMGCMGRLLRRDRLQSSQERECAVVKRGCKLGF